MAPYLYWHRHGQGHKHGQTWNRNTFVRYQYGALVPIAPNELPKTHHGGIPMAL